MFFSLDWEVTKNQTLNIKRQPKVVAVWNQKEDRLLKRIFNSHYGNVLVLSSWKVNIAATPFP